LCPTPSVFRVIKSEKLRFKRNAARMMMRNPYNILAVKLKENATYETAEDGRIILYFSNLLQIFN
jgi:hypothetical protein